MIPALYVRPALPATANGRIDSSALVARWWTELQAAPDTPRAVVLAGRIARADPQRLAVHDSSGQIAAALAVADSSAWRERFLRTVEECADPTAVIDELDALELVWAAAERVGGAPPGLRAALDGCVELLVAHALELLPATEYVQSVAATFRPNLADEAPILARTTEKFVALLDAAEVAERDERPLPGLNPPTGAPAQPTPAQPGRVPALPAGFPLAAGAPVELPAVAPYEWRGGKKGHTAELHIPRVPPTDRTLKLIVDPADVYAGKAVLLGGLRGEVGADGMVAFDWDDVVAIGALIEHLVIGGGGAWKVLATGERDE